MVVFGLGKDLLIKSVLGHCDVIRYGAIHMIRKHWTGRFGSEMTIFAYYQYINCAYRVSGWVRKCPKTCLHNI